MLEDIFATEPLMTNEIGRKYWIDTHSTEYAQRQDKYGTALEGTVFFTESKEGVRSRVYIDETQQILAEESSMEGMGARIDILKLLCRKE